MAGKPGYWDVRRCAWVDAEPSYVAPPLQQPTAAEGSLSAVDATVPEQRPDEDVSLVAGTPD